MKTTMKFEGFKELDAALGEFNKATAVNILKRAGIEAMEPMRGVAARMAPDDPATGAKDLKDNIVVSAKTRRRRKESTVEVYMGPDADVPCVSKKGVQQEFGNINHGPQPFMRPAYEQEKVPTVGRVRDSLAKEIEKARVRAARKALRAKGGK